MWQQGYTIIKFKNAQGVNNFSASNYQGGNNVTILDQMPNMYNYNSSYLLLAAPKMLVIQFTDTGRLQIFKAIRKK